MSYVYPIMLQVRGRPIVIIGGGKVASRKARGLVAAGANRIRVVALKFDPAMPNEAERVNEAYHANHLDGVELAFAATDSAQINTQVVGDAHRRGIWVMRADFDSDEPGDFTVPALFRQETVTVAVSTAGSAALAVAIRDGLEARFDSRWAQMARAMEVLRPRLRDDPNLSGAQRRTLLRELANEEAFGVLEQSGIEGLSQWIWGRGSKTEGK